MTGEVGELPVHGDRRQAERKTYVEDSVGGEDSEWFEVSMQNSAGA